MTARSCYYVRIVSNQPLRMHGSPTRIFVSVDESIGRSTISFQPPECSAPITHENDHKGDIAMREAKAVSAKYPSCTVHGPHFHAALPPGRKRPARRPPR